MKKAQWSLCLLAALLAAVLGAFPVCASAAAGSLRITLTDRQGCPAGNTILTLYRVAETDGTLTENFSDADIPADSLLSQKDAASNAKILADWAVSRKLVGSDTVTDSRGKASFSPLSLGVYLAVCPSGQSVTFPPFLTSIPLTENRRILYDVTAYPKAEKPGPNRPADPNAPDKPDVPDLPDVPDIPAEPDKPAQPSLPQTGTDPFPVYGLLSIGGALVTLGLADLLRQRRHAHDETE